MVTRVLLASLFFTVFVTISASGQNSPVTAPQVSLGDRTACQTAIEQVYWRHRIAPGEDATTSSFTEAVPQEVIQRNAEDAILKSLAFERYWGVTITGEQLQAELDRMAANSKSPDVLAELFAAVGNDPQAAAECLARPLLVDRLIQSYFASDQRFHGELKARVQAELASAAPATMKNMSGQYREMEWQRGRNGLKPGVMALESSEFDAAGARFAQHARRPFGKSGAGAQQLARGYKSFLRRNDDSAGHRPCAPGFNRMAESFL